MLSSLWWMRRPSRTRLLRHQPLPTIKTPAPESARPIHGRAMGDSRTCILVVDDAPEFLDFLDALLTAEGYRVVAAATWEAASAALASLRPHLVIADVRLSGQPAFTVLDELRADQKTRDIPVLLCTGAVTEVGERAEALRREGVE